MSKNNKTITMKKPEKKPRTDKKKAALKVLKIQQKKQKGK